MSDKKEVAIFGAGCFWCVEAVFQDLRGVELVESGYMGGHKDNPTYEEVCTGQTGHAEVTKITYDPSLIGYADLLAVLFEVHDPTTLNQQGADKGTQYRSAIYYTSEEQKVLAEKAKKAAGESGVWANPIVTEITQESEFYKADNYHQNYFKENPNASFCAYVIRPKVDKFKKRFGDMLKG